MIPDYQSLMLPVLQSAEKGAVQTKDVIASLAEELGLSSEDCAELLPSGKQRTFDNRVHWAKTYLKQAGLLSYPKRSFFVATEEGRRVLSRNLDRIDNKFLEQYDAFQEFKSRKGRWSGCVATALMAVPKAAMHEDDCVMLRKHEVRSPGDILRMQPVTEATCMKRPPKHQFGLRVLSLDPGHHAGTGVFVYDIRHVHPGLRSGT